MRDYERIAALGAKRTIDLSRSDQESSRAALGRLIADGLAIEEQGAIALRRPEDCPTPLDESFDKRMLASYLGWLRSGGSTQPARPRQESGERGLSDEGDIPADELLYGELGFWQHWWNRIRERDYDALGPLPMDIVVPDDGTFEVRSWLAEFDPEIRTYVLGGGLLRGRVIVPARVLRSAVEPMLDLSAESGFEVRVLSTDARFVLYDGCVAVLNEPLRRREERTEDQFEGQPEPYWAVRNPAIIDPLRHFFSLLWRTAIPFEAHRGVHEEMLALLARGYTDAGIAQALNLSARTVSRRVSEIMAEYGAGSRFELGMMYGRSHIDS